MFAIVWVWAFPLMVLPTIQHWENMVPVSEWLPRAFLGPGIERIHLKFYLIFVLFVIALFLPVKSFFWVKRPPEPGGPAGGTPFPSAGRHGE